MELKKLQTNVKDNKRQLLEEIAFIDEEQAKAQKIFNTNVTTLKNNLNYLSMLPTGQCVDVALTTSTIQNTAFYAPFNGYFFVSLQNSNTNHTFYLNNETAGGIACGSTITPYATLIFFVPCKKGDKINYYRDGVPQNIWWARFVKGGQV